MPKQRGGGFFSRFDTSQLRITRGAMILLFILVGVSIVYLVSDYDARASLERLFAPSSDAVFRDYKVWTLFTGPFFEVRFGPLLFEVLTLWFFVPTLERWWGLKRFLTFFAATSLAGTLAGSLMGLVTGHPEAITGYDPFIFASVVAFGILYGRQPVSFFGILPMTGRQFMYGMIALMVLMILVGQQWEAGTAWAAGMGVGALLASGRWNPRLWWYKWRHNRVRRKLEVLDGGRARPKRPTDEMLN